MDLLYGSAHKFSDLDEDMNEFMDNDMMLHSQLTTPTDSGGFLDDEWFNSFFVDPVLNDKMITDTVESPHIKCEHSYSSMNENIISMIGDLDDIGRVEDLESELFKSQGIDISTKYLTSCILPKSESLDQDIAVQTSTASTSVTTHTFTVTKQQPTIILASSQGQATFSERSVLQKITVKSEPADIYDTLDHTVNVDSLVLPPTPPSSSNSDSDSCSSPQRSAPSSPIRHLPYTRQTERSSSSISTTGSSCHYSHQLLYTSQNDNCVDIVFQQIPTSGVLMLTEEEKRTLVSEGYPIPTKLPLTKQEEKNLKKIRRKIKNKISAQESRRKKKEYLEALEKRVESFSNENNELKKKVDSLENNNRSLLSQLQKLQTLVGKIPHPTGKVPQTGLMVLVLCFAVFLGSWTPTSLNIGYTMSKPMLHTNMPYVNHRLVKPPIMMSLQLENAKVDSYYTMPMRSRVLMSFRGEQEELKQYDINGPNAPNAGHEKVNLEQKNSENQIEFHPKTFADTKPVNKVENNQEVVVENELVKTVLKVMEVTVDGHFGHTNHSWEVIRKDIPQPYNKVEGHIESFDTI